MPKTKKIDITLSQFLSNTTKMLVVIMITIVSLSKLGISVTPFVAAIGAISLGAGLALQGLLSNYAAGFNIILIRPFVVGDTITVHGVTGVVEEVLLAYTVLKKMKMMSQLQFRTNILLVKFYITLKIIRCLNYK